MRGGGRGRTEWGSEHHPATCGSNSRDGPAHDRRHGVRHGRLEQFVAPTIAGTLVIPPPAAISLAAKVTNSTMPNSIWLRFVNSILAPQADEASIRAEIEKARNKAGAPVLWLLGKAQAGKSSVIQGLTGSTAIEIGNGFRACTRSSDIYDFPSEQESLIRFLDTRGIGEPCYDPQEDLAWAERQAHGVLVVMRACDPGQEIIKTVLAQVRKRKPEWPVVLVQTTLHEGYPRGTEHPQPYCFDNSPLADAVPPDLARALEYQHRDFNGLFDRHVAIDFTHPDDGYEPRLYGDEALWAALAGIVPAGFRAVIAGRPELTAGVRDVLFSAAFPHIVSYSTVAGLAAMVPVPAANIPGVGFAQSKMLHSIASIYGLPLLRGLEALGVAIGTGFVARTVARSLLAGIPVVGTALAGLLTASTTYALGCALCWYFAEVKRGAVPTSAQIQKVYGEELSRGRERFRDYFRRRGRPAKHGATTPGGRLNAT